MTTAVSPWAAAADLLDPPPDDGELTWAEPADLAQYAGAPHFHRPPHLDLLSRELAACAAEDDGRLMVNMPPRHGKTELSSVWTPTWYLQEHPRRRVILASYTIRLARGNGRRIRNLVRDHPDRLDLRLSEDSQAADLWHTTAGGGLMAVGVGGSITGFGGDLVIVDDPVKDRKDAESPTWRQAAWEWYTDTLYTRLEPGASLVVVATRWHRDDLPGRILRHAQSTGERWRVVNLPALAGPDDPLGREEGEALWPERYPVRRLHRIRDTEGPYGWSSLYQGTPIVRDAGAYWTEPMLEAAQARAPRTPAGLLAPDFRRVVVAYDPSGSSEPGADEAGIVVAGLDRAGSAGVLEDLSGRLSPLQAARRVVEAFHRHGADAVIYERNMGGAHLESPIREAARELGLPVPPMRSVWASHGKSARAEPVSALYEAGRVWHAGPFPELSLELTSWTPDSRDSPNRLDALVWAVSYLLIGRPKTLQRG